MSKRHDHAIWRHKYLLPMHRIALPIRSCLLEQGSLTYYLKKCFKGNIHIELKAQVWAVPAHTEQGLLKLRAAESALIREVVLKYSDTDLVCARTVIPRQSLAGKNKIIQKLSARPIGTILFSNARVNRKQIRYTSIQKTGISYRCAAPLAYETVIWGRRSLFELNYKPLLITEFFLPALGQLLCEKK